MSPLALKSAASFRDLGGLGSADGRRLKSRRLFRSDALTTLDEADRRLLRELGVRLVCDLRSAPEREVPCILGFCDPMPQLLHLDINADLRSGDRELLDFVRRDPGASGAHRLMLETYSRLPRALARHLPSLFAALLDQELPALIHCTAGKDRTGITCAVVLSALGIPREAIYTDYLRAPDADAAQRLRERTAKLMVRLLGGPMESAGIDILSEVRAEFLDTSFAVIDRDWGGMSSYLRAAGLDAARHDALRDRLLE
jgi:protein-tyrosine phosphatase